MDFITSEGFDTSIQSPVKTVSEQIPSLELYQTKTELKAKIFEDYEAHEQLGIDYVTSKDINHPSIKTETFRIETEIKSGVASATVEAAVSGETAAAVVPKRPTVCHFLWRAEECTVEGCQKSHPPPCNTLSRCLELDQNLPRWKSTGCKKWHGGTKSSRPKPRKPKKSKGNPQKVPSQKSRAFHGSRPQTMGRA